MMTHSIMVWLEDICGLARGYLPSRWGGALPLIISATLTSPVVALQYWLRDRHLASSHESLL